MVLFWLSSQKFYWIPVPGNKNKTWQVPDNCRLMWHDTVRLTWPKIVFLTNQPKHPELQMFKDSKPKHASAVAFLGFAVWFLGFLCVRPILHHVSRRGALTKCHLGFPPKKLTSCAILLHNKRYSSRRIPSILQWLFAFFGSSWALLPWNISLVNRFLWTGHALEKNIICWAWGWKSWDC